MRLDFTTIIMREGDFLEKKKQRAVCDDAVLCASRRREKREAMKNLYFYYYLNGPKASTSLREVSIALLSFISVVLLQHHISTLIDMNWGSGVGERIGGGIESELDLGSHCRSMRETRETVNFRSTMEIFFLRLNCWMKCDYRVCCICKNRSRSCALTLEISLIKFKVLLVSHQIDLRSFSACVLILISN